jgi:glycosyltransferase involved in cell wall biosynthesis
MAPRRTSLLAAINGLLDQRGAAMQVTLVVNGDGYCPELLSELKSRSDLCVYHQPEASLVAALRTGRLLVDAEFFCFLDDDDRYLPGAVEARLVPLRSDRSVDVVISDGYKTEGGRRVLMLGDGSSAATIERDPVGCMMHQLWLNSASALYRTSTVSADLFRDIPPYREWTYLALRLALESTLRFIDTPTFALSDTPGSLSKTEDYKRASSFALSRMLEMPMPRNARRLLRLKRAGAFHQESNFYRLRGDLRRAWAFHLRSLAHPGSFAKYSLYTRKLLSRPKHVD